MTLESSGRLILVRTQQVVAHTVWIAVSLQARLVGLLASRSLPDGCAMVFPRCRSIHTWGMRFPIDVVFVDRDWRIVTLAPNVRPWRLIPTVWSAWAAIELAAGTIRRTDLQLGDQLHYQGDGSRL